jgi:SnoaL-like domain
MAQLHDGAGLADLMNSYFSSLDRRDWESLTLCFAPTATASFNSGTTQLNGRSAIVSWIAEMFGSRSGDSPARSSIHDLANIEVSTDGPSGSVDAFAVAHLVDGPDSPVIVRGLRYKAACAQLETGWCFDSFRHQALWQFRADAEAPRARGARIDA